MLKHLVGALALVIALSPLPVLANSEAKCGGGGGTKSARLTCPSGTYAIGITARGASYVDRFGIRCAKFGSNGKRQSPGPFQIGGSGGGSTTGSATCGTDQAVTGVSTRADWYVDRISGGVCAKRDGSSGFAEFDPNLDGSDLAISVGGSGGAPCDLQCAEGEAIFSVFIRYGSWIDSITIKCKP
jgi:hypothetical protein